jgi:alkaline phosphatase D
MPAVPMRAEKPPETIRFGNAEIANFRKDGHPQTLLGATQKQWFLERLLSSKATLKIWGNTLGTLDYRFDPQNLPVGLTRPWSGSRYGDASTAGLAAPALPPQSFEPVGIAFVTCSISAPSNLEKLERLPQGHQEQSLGSRPVSYLEPNKPKMFKCGGVASTLVGSQESGKE